MKLLESQHKTVDTNKILELHFHALKDKCHVSFLRLLFNVVDW